MKAKVFAVLKRAVSELQGKLGARTLRNGMEVECKINEVSRFGNRIVYEIIPIYPVPENYRLELQLVEWGERNIGAVVTNFSGTKLIPRWRGKHTVIFRTSKGNLISVIGYAVRGMVQIIVYEFKIEGKTVYLTEEGFGPYEARYDESKKTWLVNLPQEFKRLEAAVIAAMEKAGCNCFRKGCRYHYALSEEEAKKVLAERRERQRALAESAKTAVNNQLAKAPVLGAVENSAPAVEPVTVKTTSVESTSGKTDEVKKSSKKTSAPTVLDSENDSKDSQVPDTVIGMAMKKAGLLNTKK